MAKSQNVLVVDGLPETEEVLKAVFEKQGHRINRIRSQRAVDHARQSERPQVLILDMDDGDPATLFDGLWDGVPRVLIGARYHAPDATNGVGAARFLEKPFEYPELVQAIGQLLEVTAG